MKKICHASTLLNFPLLFTACDPSHPPAKRFIQLFVAGEVLYEPFDAESLVILITNECNGAHALAIVVLVQFHFNVGSAVLLNGDDTVGLRPGGCTFVDKRKD